MTGFCTPDLMKKLEPAKNRLKEIAEAKAEKKVQGFLILGFLYFKF